MLKSVLKKTRASSCLLMTVAWTFCLKHTHSNMACFITSNSNI